MSFAAFWRSRLSGVDRDVPSRTLWYECAHLLYIVDSLSYSIACHLPRWQSDPEYRMATFWGMRLSGVDRDVPSRTLWYECTHLLCIVDSLSYSIACHLPRWQSDSEYRMATFWRMRLRGVSFLRTSSACTCFRVDCGFN